MKKPKAHYDRGIYWLPVWGEELGTLRYHMHESALQRLMQRESYWRACLLDKKLPKEEKEGLRSELKETNRQIKAVKKVCKELERFPKEAHNKI